jgi:hypothetical protein
MKTYFTLFATSDKLELSKQVFQEGHSIKKGQDQESRNRLHSDLKEWLEFYNCRPLYDEALAVWQAGTGNWFLQGYFSRWSSCIGGSFRETQPTPFLRLRCKSGSGKTTMLSSAISNIRNAVFGQSWSSLCLFLLHFQSIVDTGPACYPRVLHRPTL